MLGASISDLYQEDIAFEPRSMKIAQEMDRAFDVVASSRMISSENADQFYLRLSQIELLLNNATKDIKIYQLDISEDIYNELVLILKEMQDFANN